MQCAGNGRVEIRALCCFVVGAAFELWSSLWVTTTAMPLQA